MHTVKAKASCPGLSTSHFSFLQHENITFPGHSPIGLGPGQNKNEVRYLTFSGKVEERERGTEQRWYGKEGGRERGGEKDGE